ncbi:hypothetical protein ANRL2_00917 [Anaerolineae bacterium]|nr:hypothetical protein ANRL2_00917 [Anaerolineae bacterium]
MNHYNSPADVLHALDTLSGGRLTRHRDMETLIALAQRSRHQDLLADLSFHAKFVTGTSRTLHRIGPEGTGAPALSTEMQNGLEKVKSLVRDLLLEGTAADRQQFDATYFQLTPESLQHLLALCADLGWYKNWLLDTRTHAGERSSVAWRAALIAIAVGAVLWLGSVHARALLANDLLVPGTLTMDATVPPVVERHIYHQLATQALTMIPGYLLVLAGSIVFLARSPYRPKEHGWLMMSAILLFLFVPVEAFTMVLEVRMVLLEFTGSGGLDQFRELFLARMQALAGAPLIAQLCYYTIIVLLAVQPFRKQHGRSA